MKTEKIQEVIDIIKTIPVADSASSNENVVSKKEAEQVFKEVIKSRLNHCLEQLKEHAKEASYLDGQGVIVWNGGHFFMPVYEARLKAQEQTIEEWNALIWQQIVRQMAIQGYSYEYFYIATEFLVISRLRED